MVKFGPNFTAHETDLDLIIKEITIFEFSTTSCLIIFGLSPKIKLAIGSNLVKKKFITDLHRLFYSERSFTVKEVSH